MALYDPRFRDVAEREDTEKELLSNQRAKLKAKKDASVIALTNEEERELDRITKILDIARDPKSTEVLDPLFVGVRELLRAEDCRDKYLLLSHKNGQLEIEVPTGPTAATAGPAAATAVPTIAAHTSDAEMDDGHKKAVVLSALILGLLSEDRVKAPRVIVYDGTAAWPTKLTSDRTDETWKWFNQAFYAALGEARALFDLAMKVLPILSLEGDPDGRGRDIPTVKVSELAFVMRELRARGIRIDEIQLKRKVNEGLNKFQNVSSSDPIDGFTLEPPDLGEISGVTIEKENVRLMGPMIVAAMMDQVGGFQTLDHIVLRFTEATLTNFSRRIGQKLYKWWRDAPNRMSEMERRTFYAITLGIPGGEPTDFVNKGFNDLFLRFVSSVSDLVRQKELDHVLRATIPLATHQQQCRKAGRDLIENLSMHGYGMAFYAAQELSQQVNEIIDILSDPDIRSNYGARDMWQVIDQVATFELGGAKSTSRYRTLATCGTIITAWLANNVARIMDPTLPIINMMEVRHPQPRPSGQKAITHPNDYDLVNACELWLADNAIPDSQVNQLVGTPRESPAVPSRPIQLPSMVQDVLSDVGVGFGR